MKTTLGFKRSEEYGGDMPVPASEGDGKKEEEKIIYPELNIRGLPAKKMVGKLEVGQTIVATVTLSVVGLQDRDPSKGYGGGCQVEFEIQDIDVPAIDESNMPNPDEDDAEEAVDAYRREQDEEIA